MIYNFSVQTAKPVVPFAKFAVPHRTATSVPKNDEGGL
jgi:hypothetical protein